MITVKSKIINWNIMNNNTYDTIVNNILLCFNQKISDIKLDWLNNVYEYIFKYKIFIDAINESKYLYLDVENKRVIRKNNSSLNPCAEEYVPTRTLSTINVDETELLIKKMIDSVLN